LAVYAFSQHIGTLCVTHDTNVNKLATKLGIDPAELLRMFNGKMVPTKAVIEGIGTVGPYSSLGQIDGRGAGEQNREH
jgi:hypothetical protein